MSGGLFPVAMQSLCGALPAASLGMPHRREEALGRRRPCLASPVCAPHLRRCRRRVTTSASMNIALPLIRGGDVWGTWAALLFCASGGMLAESRTQWGKVRCSKYSWGLGNNETGATPKDQKTTPHMYTQYLRGGRTHRWSGQILPRGNTPMPVHVGRAHLHTHACPVRLHQLPGLHV